MRTLQIKHIKKWKFFDNPGHWNVCLVFLSNM